MAVGDSANLNDKAFVAMSGEDNNGNKDEDLEKFRKEDYGLVINTTEKTIQEALTVAVTMKEKLNKPIVIILK